MKKIYQQILLIIVAIVSCSIVSNAQKQWSPFGIAGFSASGSHYVDLALDTKDSLYIAFKDLSTFGQATVMKYTSNNWVTIGNPTFSLSVADYTSIAIDKSGSPHVVYCDWGKGRKATVMKYNGVNWIPLGVEGFSADVALSTMIAIDTNGVPYVAYKDIGNGGKATVMKYNGNAWVTVGNAGFSPGAINTPSFALDKTGTPYIAFVDSSKNSKATVMKYNGTNWVVVGLQGFSPDKIEEPSLAIDKFGTPYVAYEDYANGREATVMKYVSNSWVAVGVPGFSSGGSMDIDYLSLAIKSDSTPVLAYRLNSNLYKATVMEYDGSAWNHVGKMGISVTYANFLSLIINKNDMMYLGYSDNDKKNKATVMTFDCPTLSNANICVAYTDTITGKNVIVWDNPPALHADTFRLHIDSAGAYKSISNMGGIINRFIDNNAKPNMQSYKYKLTLLDSCGREMDIDSSIAHKTILLKYDSVFNNQVAISWNIYEGIPNLKYIVKRSNNSGVFDSIANITVIGNDTVFVDKTPPPGSNRYRIDAIIPNPCNIAGVVYDRITSNIVTVQNTSIKQFSKSNQVIISPNPTNNELRVVANQIILKAEVFDVTGKKMISQTGSGNKEMVIVVSDLASGFYFLKVNDIQYEAFTKL